MSKIKFVVASKMPGKNVILHGNVVEEININSDDNSWEIYFQWINKIGIKLIIFDDAWQSVYEFMPLLNGLKDKMDYTPSEFAEFLTAMGYEEDTSYYK